MFFWIPAVLLGVAALFAIVGVVQTVRSPKDTGYFGNYRVRRFWSDSGGAEWAWVFAMIAILPGLVWFGACLTVDEMEQQGWTTKDPSCHRELVALNTGQATEMSGDFFLGTGYVSGGSYAVVTYLQQDSDGGVSLKEQRANDSRIFEDAPAGTGYMECVVDTREYDRSFIYPWEESRTEYRRTGYEFHVPPGTVVRDFEVAP